MTIPTEQIKKLREVTGAGVLEAKRALEDAQGDFEKASTVLKAKGMAAAAKKAERVAREGLIETYIHTGGRVGAMLEINCETDFVARTSEFRELAHDLALQIAASNPRYVSEQDIPPEVREKQQSEFAAQAAAEGKTGSLVDRVVQGRMEKFYNENCLLRQTFIRDENTTVHDLIQSRIAKLKENIVVRRFARFELGE